MPATLHELLQAYFGLNTTYHRNPLVAQCAATLTRLISTNPNRLSLLLVNAGANRIYVSPSNQVAVGAGIILVPNGGTLSLTWDRDFEFVTSEFYGIGDGGVSNVEIIEVVAI